MSRRSTEDYFRTFGWHWLWEMISERWKRLMYKLLFGKTQNQIRRKKNKRLQYQLIRCAAFLALPLFLSSVILGYLYFNESSDEKIQYASITASTGSVVR